MEKTRLLHMHGIPVPEHVRVLRLFTAFRATYDRSFYFDGEAHDFWELVFVTDGSVGVTSGSEVFTLTQGQIVLHAPMEFHRIWAAENTTPTVIILSFSAEHMPDHMPKVCTLSAQDMERLIRVFNLIVSSFDRRGVVIRSVRNDRLQEAAHAVCLLENLLLSWSDSVPALDAADFSPAARQYRTILAALEAHLSEPLTIAQLAADCHMSESALKKIFHRYAGTGVMHYFTEMKIRAAMTALREGERVCAVSAALGFENQNYFSTVFKRITGKSPLQFRRADE